MQVKNHQIRPKLEFIINVVALYKVMMASDDPSPTSFIWYMSVHVTKQINRITMAGLYQYHILCVICWSFITSNFV
jgi:hypothetical protein